MRLDLLYTMSININIRPILHGTSSHVLHHFGWGWVGVGWIGVGWGGVNTIFTLSLMFFGSVLVNSLRYKYIHTYIHTYIHMQGLSQDLITGGQFVPLAKILGDIFIFRGTDKLIFIQLFFFFYIHTGKPKKTSFFT